MAPRSLTWLLWPEGTVVRIVALVVLSLGALGFNGVLYVIAGEIAGAARAGQAVALMSTALFGGGALAAVPLGALADAEGYRSLWIAAAVAPGSACSRRSRLAPSPHAGAAAGRSGLVSAPPLCCLRGCAVSGRTGARAHRRLARSGWAWRRAP